MEIVLISNILLFIACYHLFGNWEIPIEIKFDPFKVVGGFPTVINTFYEEIQLFSRLPLENLPENVEKSFTRNLRWSCPILEGENECFTRVTSSECVATSSISVEFWENPKNSKCFHLGKNEPVDCKIPFLRGNLCENVVFSIEKSENGNFSNFQIDDVIINTQIVQKYREIEHFAVKNGSFCKNYTINEMVLAGNSGNDTNLVEIFQFGVNSTIFGNSTCNFSADRFLCNCPNSPSCKVQILAPSENENSTSCSLKILHWRGFIYSALMTSSGNSDSRSSIDFLEVYPAPPVSKFEQRPAKFKFDLFYPFTFLNSLDLWYQSGVLLFSAIFGLAISSIFF